MTQEDKELLLKDLSARLLYGVKVQINSDVKKVVGIKNGFVVTKERGLFSTKEYITRIECCRPYLRRLSSMTDEEKREFKKILDDGFGKIPDAGISGLDDFAVKILEINASSEVVDWLNKKMFAYRVIDGKDMFELGLAIEAPDNMYK